MKNTEQRDAEGSFVIYVSELEDWLKDMKEAKQKVGIIHFDKVIKRTYGDRRRYFQLAGNRSLDF